MDGAFVIDKPAGMTSHDVVDRVRRSLATRRVGHGGTLDPDATGILLVGVGKATRFLSYAQAAPKRYRAVVRFGSSTTTQDAAGEVVGTAPTGHLAEDVIRNELKSFCGEIEQIPPMVSAVRIGGERLHAKARRGEDVERPPRTVTIYELELIQATVGDEVEATLDVLCSGGTFIRTLAHDLGVALGSAAHLSELRRTEAGGFTLEDAISLESVGAETLRPMTDVVKILPATEVDAHDAALVANGRPLPISSELDPGTSIAVTGDGELLAVYRVEADRIVAERVVPR
jgi:tRNA pseudouridine55 synthase